MLCDWIKSLQKFGIIWKLYFWELLGNEVYLYTIAKRGVLLHIIAKRFLFALQIMLRIASFRDIAFRRYKVRKEMSNLGWTTIHFGTSVLMAWINAIPDDNLNQYHCGLFYWAQIWYISFLTPPPCEGNISALHLVYCYK